MLMTAINSWLRYVCCKNVSPSEDSGGYVQKCVQGNSPGGGVHKNSKFHVLVNTQQADIGVSFDSVFTNLSAKGHIA